MRSKNRKIFKDNYEEKISELFALTSFSDNPENSAHKLLNNRKIVIYGAGGWGNDFFLHVIARGGYKVHSWLDCKFKSNDVYRGFPAFSPSEYNPTSEERENAIVVIAIGKKKQREEALHYLQGLGFKNIVLAIDIYESHLYVVPAELEEKGFSYYLDRKNKILAGLELFTDNVSREIYYKFIQTHMKKRPVSIPNDPVEEQYFPNNIKFSKGYSRFINCGAYNGDTVKSLNVVRGKIEALICFEPDEKSFASLVEFLQARHEKIAKEIMAFPCAVYSEEKRLRFVSAGDLSSMISDQGNVVIQCVSMDHVVPDFKPTFINMDIEGVELEALMGAETLVKKNKPDLAVCVYHSLNHIWDIPLYLESLHLGYKFYLRNYTSFASETVLYVTT